MTEEVVIVRIQIDGVFVTISASVREGDEGDRLLPSYDCTDDDDRPLGRVWRIHRGEAPHTKWSKSNDAVQTWYARPHLEPLGPFPELVPAVRALLGSSKENRP